MNYTHLINLILAVINSVANCLSYLEHCFYINTLSQIMFNLIFIYKYPGYKMFLIIIYYCYAIIT